MLRLLLLLYTLRNLSGLVASQLAALDNVFAEEVFSGLAGGVSNASSPLTGAGDTEVPPTVLNASAL